MDELRAFLWTLCDDVRRCPPAAANLLPEFSMGARLIRVYGADGLAELERFESILGEETCNLVMCELLVATGHFADAGEGEIRAVQSMAFAN